MLTTSIKVLLFILLCIFSWIDYDTTRLMWIRDGSDIEVNPLLRWLVVMTNGEHIHYMLYFKIGMLVIVSLVLYFMHIRTIFIITIIYATVAALNSYTIGVNI